MLDQSKDKVQKRCHKWLAEKPYSTSSLPLGYLFGRQTSPSSLFCSFTNKQNCCPVGDGGCWTPKDTLNPAVKYWKSGSSRVAACGQNWTSPPAFTHYVQIKWKQIHFTQRTDSFQSFQMLFGGKLLVFESRTTLVICAIVNSADCSVNKSLKSWI